MNHLIIALLLIVMMPATAHVNNQQKFIKPVEEKQLIVPISEQTGGVNRWQLSDKIAVGAAISSLLQFIAMLWTLYIMRDTARRQLRAYLGLTPPFFGVMNPDEIHITVKNAGQTPAYNVQSHINYVSKPHGMDLEKEFTFPNHTNANWSKSVAVVNTNAEIKFTYAFDPQKIRDARAFLVDIFIYGQVDYKDIFGMKRVSRFCYKYLPSPDLEKIKHGLEMHELYNEAT